MIEKPYGRPAIGDMVGYMSMLSLGSNAMSMLVKVEGTTVEIPVDLTRIASLREQYPSGSRVTLWFYDGKWHFDDTEVAKPRMGIPISELLARHGKASAATESMVMGPFPEQKISYDEPPEEELQMDTRYINEIELEFKGEAEELLKSMNLSYLRAKSPGKAHGYGKDIASGR